MKAIIMGEIDSFFSGDITNEKVCDMITKVEQRLDDDGLNKDNPRKISIQYHGVQLTMMLTTLREETPELIRHTCLLLLCCVAGRFAG